MTSEDRVEERVPPHGTLPEHPVRVALLDLLAAAGTVTSTQAAERLGSSSGLCSFHLRRLARAGLIEEAPSTDGRARPWRLRWDLPEEAPEQPGLPDYQRWLERRAGAPARWQRDEAVTTVVNLTPRELRELADDMKALVARYESRGKRRGMKPVAVVARLFPLLEDR
ncbi:MAG TPA: winged helix-turn-helix domain-containing protein [Amycolatopsis sp.]|nr:winged helix-turn-helix domain-containing protein [Amycolatopsis sp.]